MRNPNRKHKPKHMTKIKYRRVELDWILVYQKNSKKISVKPPFESREEYSQNYNINAMLFADYEDYVIWYIEKCKHLKYKRYGMAYYLEK